MTDYPHPVLPNILPRTVEEMLAYVANEMRRHNPKTDAEIDAMYEEFGDEDEDGRPLHRLTEEGIAEQIDATVERRGLQKIA